MRKLFTAAVLVLFLGFPALTRASWVNVVYDPDLPAQTRQNVQLAVDTTADLLTKYKITLSQEVTVVVTADAASYVQALMLYAKIPQAEAEKSAKFTGGKSINCF